MKQGKNRQTAFTLNPVQIYRQLGISLIGSALSMVYLAWALFLLSKAMEDGLKCGIAGGSIISICADSLLFIAATFSIDLLANFIGIKPDYLNIRQWFLYICLCLILVYFFGFYIERIIQFFVNATNRNKSS